jgi:hypothetical protein
VIESALPHDVAGVKEIGRPEIGAGVDDAIAILVEVPALEGCIDERRDAEGGEQRARLRLHFGGFTEPVRGAVDADGGRAETGEVAADVQRVEPIARVPV